MIVKGKKDPKQKGRRVYNVNGALISAKHFVTRDTAPDNPFSPHKHEQTELWFIIKGEAFYFENGKETPVKEGDMMVIKPWVEHGLRTNSSVKWICLG